MDRLIVYPGEVPLDTHLLTTNRNALIALGMFAQTVLGTGVVVDGLACTPGSGLVVQVGQGQIYSLSTVDPVGYSSLGQNSTPIIKQGLNLSAVNLSCPAPSTVGYSIAYLVECQFQEVDNTSVVLPYFNSAAPTVAWTGPSGSGAAQNTQRQDICAIQIKAGTAAATGSQVTPTADSGWTGIWVVTVANGQASISAGNITLAPGAPYIVIKLPQVTGLPSPQLPGTALMTNGSVGVWGTPHAQLLYPLGVC